MTHISDAVRDAIASAQDQRATVPELPVDWVERAGMALEAEHNQVVMDLAVELVEAHSGYKASWDHWPWLDSLREATRVERALRDAKTILGYGEADRAVQYYCRFAGSSAGAAKMALGIR